MNRTSGTRSAGGRPAQNSGEQRRVRGKPFPKGVSGNPGGRPKDIGAMRELARSKTDAAFNVLVASLRSKSEKFRIAAALALLDRGWGRPTQPIEGVGEEGPVVIQIVKFTGSGEDETVRVEHPFEAPSQPAQAASASAPMPEPQPEAPRASEGACGPASVWIEAIA